MLILYMELMLIRVLYMKFYTYTVLSLVLRVHLLFMEFVLTFFIVHLLLYMSLMHILFQLC